MELTNENYYSVESNLEYMSHSQYLQYAGHGGVIPCEERALKMLHGEWEEAPNKAMMVGSYVDAYFEGTLEEFKKEHPDIFTAKGELRAEYKQAEVMIKRCQEDAVFMEMMSGEKQVIMSGDFAGQKWKIKIDSYLPERAIVDLKTSADIHKYWYGEGGQPETFVEHWGYTMQMALYQKIVEINTGKKLPCYIAVVTKEEFPEIEAIKFDQDTLDTALEEVKENMPRIIALRNGEILPCRCERCNYCKSTKKLMKPIHFLELINE